MPLSHAADAAPWLCPSKGVAGESRWESTQGSIGASIHPLLREPARMMAVLLQAQLNQNKGQMNLTYI